MVKEMSDLELELSDKLAERERIRDEAIGDAIGRRLREKAEALLEGELERSYWTQRPGQFSDNNPLVMDGIRIELKKQPEHSLEIRDDYTLRIYQETKEIENSFLPRASLLKVIKKEKISSSDLVYENKVQVLNGQIKKDEITRHIRPGKQFYVEGVLNWQNFLQQQYENLLKKLEEHQLPPEAEELNSKIDYLSENFQ